MSLHQSTCLTQDTNDESDLWILPDFDEWEAASDAERLSPQQESPQWAPLLARAVSSNKERLRRRLEGDGWDFVGGKYGYESALLKDERTASQESLDEEFDLVVLPVVEVAC
jgi:hypothetical protein